MAFRVRTLALAGLVLAVVSPAFAQSGQIACEQDIERASRLYSQKQAALSAADRQEVQDLMEVARSRCESGGANALNTRSPEATALLEKLEDAPMPQQAQQAGRTPKTR